MRKSLDSLISELNDENAQTRHAAAFALAQLKDNRATEALAAAMYKWRDKSGDMAALTIRRIGRKQGAKFLMQAMCDERLWLRERAVQTFSVRHGDYYYYREEFEPLARELFKSFEITTEDCLREGLARAFSQWRIMEWGIIAPLKVHPLLAALDGENETVREYIAMCLAIIFSRHWTLLVITEEEKMQFVPKLISLLQDESHMVRANAARALGRTQTDDAIPALTKSLSDEASEVRKWSVYSLGRLRATGFTRHFMIALNDNEAMVRLAAVQALRRMRSHDAIPALIEGLNDPDIKVRLAIVKALGRIGDPSATPFLIECLQNDDASDVRVWAAKSLAHLKDKKAISALIQALSTDIGRVAAYALRLFDDELARTKAKDWLDKHP